MFSNVPPLKRVERGRQRAIDVMAATPAAVKSPKHIDDQPEAKAPSRSKRKPSNVSYGKPGDGSITAQKIRSEILKSSAFNFTWLAQIRELAQQ